MVLFTLLIKQNFCIYYDTTNHTNNNNNNNNTQVTNE
eukprot:COSAG05_NODE_17135_length_331_cov_0.875000_1_plen_36_part_10